MYTYNMLYNYKRIYNNYLNLFLYANDAVLIQQTEDELHRSLYRLYYLRLVWF